MRHLSGGLTNGALFVAKRGRHGLLRRALRGERHADVDRQHAAPATTTRKTRCTTRPAACGSSARRRRRSTASPTRGRRRFRRDFAADGTWQLTRDSASAAYENSWGVAVGAGRRGLRSSASRRAASRPDRSRGGDFCMVAFDHRGITCGRASGADGQRSSSSCFVDRARTGFISMSLITNGVARRHGRTAAATTFGVVKYDSTGVLR